YQADDTNGRMALESGHIVDGRDTLRLNCRLELYDFSAHCGDAQLKELVRKFAGSGTETVITVHGDNTEGFAGWVKEELGVNAIAPVNGERVYV
ncbi:MAG: MBL fold metallo-hydrolase RNA specificity domain-containing protein, partial [Candidatus Margulisbacteria bacterium]|nr:MBL fold metallo-hydrolase RNA specificity domain-containing protein [Candidatus Margulisiibacteriota bacterium]